MTTNNTTLEAAARAMYAEEEWPSRQRNVEEADRCRRMALEYWDGGHAGQAQYEKYRRLAGAALPVIVSGALLELAEDAGAFYTATWLRDRALEAERG